VSAARPKGGKGIDALPPVLTVDEVAEILRVDSKTVYEAISRGDFPGVIRVGRCIRIFRDAFLAWLQGGHIEVPNGPADSPEVVGSPRQGRVVQPNEDGR
jgi:excisionase family DNA binding protein